MVLIVVKVRDGFSMATYVPSSSTSLKIAGTFRKFRYHEDLHRRNVRVHIYPETMTAESIVLERHHQPVFSMRR